MGQSIYNRRLSPPILASGFSLQFPPRRLRSPQHPGRPTPPELRRPGPRSFPPALLKRKTQAPPERTSPKPARATALWPPRVATPRPLRTGPPLNGWPRPPDGNPPAWLPGCAPAPAPLAPSGQAANPRSRPLASAHINALPPPRQHPAFAGKPALRHAPPQGALPAGTPVHPPIRLPRKAHWKAHPLNSAATLAPPRQGNGNRPSHPAGGAATAS